MGDTEAMGTHLKQIASPAEQTRWYYDEINPPYKDCFTDVCVESFQLSPSDEAFFS